ncbi:MAG: hypothetical protein KAS99_00150 [Candidatus Omnitrophica bacterium]|nr:hypothetical protein [Candidatus Omnitrophota bacterium]
MGKPKQEMKKIHRKKVKKAKEKVKLYVKNEITYSELPGRSKRFLEKREKRGKKPV